LAIPAGITAALPTPAAFAASPTIVTCTSLTGSIGATTTTEHATGCNQVAITASSGTLTAPVGKSSFKIKWKSGKTTSGTATAGTVTPSKCPSTFPIEVSSSSKVTAGTAKTLIGASTKNLFCVNTTTGKVKLLPGTKYKI